MKPNILMLLEHPYPQDIRVLKEATSLSRVANVHVVCLRMKGQKVREAVGPVQVFRVIDLPSLEIRNRFLAKVFSFLRYSLQYFFFTFQCALVFVALQGRKRFKVIHAHNPPDTLCLVGGLGKLFGSKFIFDHHDLSPELLVTKFSGKGWPRRLKKLLIFFEGLSCRLANIIISTNQSYKDIEQARHGVSGKKIFVVRNNPDLKDFPKEEGEIQKTPGSIPVLVYLGSINYQDGLEVLMESLAILREKMGRQNFLCRIIGDGDDLPRIKEKAISLGLNGNVEFLGFIWDRARTQALLAEADICVEPAPANEVNRYSTFIKIMEYMAVARPIVAFDMPENRFSAQDAAVFIPPGDKEAFAQGIVDLLRDPSLRKTLGKRGRRRIENVLNWEESEKALFSAYCSLGILQGEPGNSVF